MGLEILVWIWVLTWMTKTAATDVIYSLQGQVPPRKRERLARAESGDAAPRRYGFGGWLADLKEDALRANTEKRRGAVASKAQAQPIDDLAEAVREAPARPASSDPDRCGLNGCDGWIVDRRGWPDGSFHSGKGDRRCNKCGWLSDHIPGKPEEPPAARTTTDPDRCPRKGCPGRIISRGIWPDTTYDTPTGDRRCSVCGPSADPIGRPPAASTGPDTTGARIIPFPTFKEQPSMDQSEKSFVQAAQDYDHRPTEGRRHELIRQGVALGIQRHERAVENSSGPAIHAHINGGTTSMANTEATGLPTAIAFAEAAASAHDSFATAGSEGYVGALERMEMGGEYVASAREAQEASSVAAAKWAGHAELLKTQNTGREFYQSNPSAAGKQALINE